MNETHKNLKHFLHTFGFQFYAITGVTCLILTVFFVGLIMRSATMVEHQVMDSRLKADLQCLQDDLAGGGPGQYRLQEGTLYVDDIALGDGNFETANLAPFRHYEDKTGTFCYVFARTQNDGELHWVEEGSYMQGHYIRVAGTTLGPHGEAIEGTYIDKKIADAIEQSEDGILLGEANVNGRPVYCCYQLLYDEDGNIVGILSDGRSVSEMKTIIWSNVLQAVVVSAILTVAIFVLFNLIAKRILNYVRQIKERLKSIGEGELIEKDLNLPLDSEFSDISNTINEMAGELREREEMRIVLENQQRDLHVAALIQSNMLNKEDLSEEKRFSAYGSMEPAREVGGDFYDYFMIDENHMAFLIADVSGKGVPAALFMMRAITTIRNLLHSGMTLAEIIRKANDSLCDNNDQQYFVTAWVGILDIPSGTVCYVNAGHNPPLLKKASGGAEWITSRKNLVLGAMDGREYSEGMLRIEKGDIVYLYTDGVTEAHNPQKKLYTDERLKQVVTEAVSADGEKLCSTVRKSLQAFCESAEQFDDITMLAVTYHGGN